MEKRKSKSDGGLKEEKLVLSYNGQSEIVRERKERKIPRSDRTSGYDVQKCRALILKPASTVLGISFQSFNVFFFLFSLTANFGTQKAKHPQNCSCECDTLAFCRFTQVCSLQDQKGEMMNKR